MDDGLRYSCECQPGLPTLFKGDSMKDIEARLKEIEKLRDTDGYTSAADFDEDIDWLIAQLWKRL